MQQSSSSRRVDGVLFRWVVAVRRGFGITSLRVRTNLCTVPYPRLRTLPLLVWPRRRRPLYLPVCAWLAEDARAALAATGRYNVNGQ